MSVYVIADPHLGHRNISKYRKFVSSTEDNTRLIQEDWNRRINKNDVVYVLGDAAFDYHSLALFGNLKGRKILVKGNHDDLVSSHDQLNVFEEIHGIIKYKGMWFSHCPIHPDELRKCKLNIHGHVHMHTIMKGWGPWRKEDPRYVNTCVDVVYPKFGSCFLTLDYLKGLV